MKLEIKPDQNFRKLAKGLGDKKVVEDFLVRVTNAYGKELRGRVPGVLQSMIEAPKGAFGIKARAAHPSQQDPAYTIRVNRGVQISRLRAGARKLIAKAAASGGKAYGKFTLRGPDGKEHTFKAAAQIGKGRDLRIRLLRAGSLPERGLGAVPVPGRKLRRDAAKDLKLDTGTIREIENRLVAKLGGRRR